MIGYISCFVAFVLCSLVYVKMVKREESGTLGKKSIIPVVLGFISPVLALVLVIVLNFLLVRVAGDSFIVDIPNLAVRSLVKAFFGAGFTEEFVKLLVALLALLFVRPKNVYSYALVFIGVGFGFTALEEIVYGGDNNLLSLARLPCFALHMVFGMIMGVNLGRAKFNKGHGLGGSAALVFAGLLLPVLWHTVYDAATVDNAGLATDVDMAFVAAVVIDVATIVMQFVMLSSFKKKSSELCKLEF